MITKAEAIDIVQKFDFFYGQREGRLLWASKSRPAQDEDVKNFRRDCEALLEYLREGCI
jgi:hypothetical protein